MKVDSRKRAQKGWKDHLLKSGIPLEYQIARVLVKEHMAVHADFSFMRRDAAGAKECSVDIGSTWYGPSMETANFSLQMLIECKYRSDEKVVLLLQDPNQLYPPMTLGGTINSFDVLVRYHLPKNAFVNLESELEFVYKGVEVHPRGAIDSELRHGIEQLRFATPALLRQVFDFELSNHPEDASAIFFAKILVTNAPLRVLHSRADIDSIRRATAVEKISKEVPAAIFYSDYGPDYEDHFRSIFRDDFNYRMDAAKIARDRLRKSGKAFRYISDPVTLMKAYANASRYECQRVGTQFFLTTLDGLPDLLKRIKRACAASYRGRTDDDGKS